MPTVDVKLDDRELQKALKRLELKLGKKVTMSAMRAGARVIKGRMAETVPVESGRLKKSLKIRQRQTLEGVEVSVGTSFPYAHLVEFGTQPHKVNGRQHPGASPRPFMRSAFNEKADEAVATIKSKLRKSVLNE
jgi:HK97 gp10 family phage protein